MDHFFQIGSLGPPDHDMLESYTTLGYLAAHTQKARLVTVVTGVVYRYPAVLAKAVTTLDVLSGGRAMLGIGAAWNQEEARALGIPFPPLAERSSGSKTRSSSARGCGVTTRAASRGSVSSSSTRSTVPRASRGPVRRS